MATHWHIVTGEYPPQPGGVSDYTRLVAEALAAEGDRVDVWAPAGPERELASSRVTVHRIDRPFSPRGLGRLSSALGAASRDGILLVQYVPTAFGYRAMNVAAAAWLASRRQRLWLMFHEVAYPVGLRIPLAQSVRGVVNRGMAALALTRAEQVFVSVPAWVDVLRPLSRRRSFTELPIPSTLPTEVAREEVAAVRARLGAGGGAVLIGHFGTYGALIAPLLESVLPGLLAKDAGRRAVLIGRGSEAFAAKIGARVHAAGQLEDRDAAAHLAACDVLFQPFPDGVTGRRTSLMAGLALGKPVVTNDGHLTDGFWRTTDALALARSPEAAELVACAESVLANPAGWTGMGERARALYRERFAMEQVVRALRERAG